MENNKNNQNPIIRKKMNSMRRRNGRKSQGPANEVVPKKPTCINLSNAEKPPIISPQAAAQQAFRNYSTKGLKKGAGMMTKIAALHGMPQTIKSNNYHTIMDNPNKSISTEPTHPSSGNNTKQLLMSNQFSGLSENKTSLQDLDGIYLHGKTKAVSVNRQNMNKVRFPLMEEGKAQPSKGSRVFSMLKSLDLQQYSRKFYELGYDHDIWKLYFLNSKQRKEFIQSLKPLPGHKDRLTSMFTMLDEIFEKEGMFDLIRQTSKRHRQLLNSQAGYSKDAKKDFSKISSQNRKSCTHSNFQIKDEKPNFSLKTKYFKLKSQVKCDLNDKLVTHFIDFEEKKKKKLKEIIEKRSNIDYNWQMALNCIYGVDKNSQKNKSLGLAKKKKKNESATRSKYVRNDSNRQK
jgi:hypothetical protein